MTQDNLTPTGLGTITTPKYADIDIAHRRRAAVGPPLVLRDRCDDCRGWRYRRSARLGSASGVSLALPLIPQRGQAEPEFHPRLAAARADLPAGAAAFPSCAK